VEIAAQTTKAPVKDGRSPLLTVDDLKDPRGLGEDLRRHTTPLSEYLWTRLSPDSRNLVERSLRGSAALSDVGGALTGELNHLLEGPSLYDPQRFSGIKLRRQTLRLIERSPTGADVVRLNRALLEDAYPTLIARVPPVLIFEEGQENNIAVVGVIGAVAGGVVGGIMGLLEGAVVGAAVGGVVSASAANFIHWLQQGNVPAVQTSLPRTALD
jgi:uncharacterized protein YcfJ